MSVERAVERRPLAPQNNPRELVAREHARRIFDEQDQQPKLGVRQFDDLDAPLGVEDCFTGIVDAIASQSGGTDIRFLYRGRIVAW